MNILSDVRMSEFRCPRCGNKYFPGGTGGLVVICPAIGCQYAIRPADMPVMLPDPAPAAFVAGAAVQQADGSADPLLYSRDAQGEMVVSGVQGSPSVLTIPASVNGRAILGVAPRAFADQVQLRRVTLPDTVAVIGESAFEGCVELESVTFGKGLTLLDRACFRGCASLDSVTLPEKLQEIGREAFSGCTMLEEVSLKGPVAVIRDSAFAMCASLSAFSYGQKPARVASSAFAGCYVLPQQVQDELIPGV